MKKINEKLKESAEKNLEQLVYGVNECWFRFHSIFPKETVIMFLSILRDHRRKDSNLRNKLTLLWAKDHAPQGLKVEALIKNNMLVLPDFTPFVEAHASLINFLNRLGFERGVFNLPLVNLFDHDKNKFVVSDEVLSQIEKAFTFQFTTPENNEMVEQFFELINIMHQQGVFDGSNSTDHIGHVMAASIRFRDGRIVPTENNPSTIMSKLLGIKPMPYIQGQLSDLFTT